MHQPCRSGRGPLVARRPVRVLRRDENALLLAAARIAPPPPAPLAAELDWDYLAQAASRQGIAPLVYATQIEPQEGTIAAAAEHFRAAYWSNHYRNARLLQQLSVVLREAACRGIPVMPLKGALLAQHYYATPALRPMSDLDLLVPPGQVAMFADLLRDLGYDESPVPAGLLDPRLRDQRHLERSFTATHHGVQVLIEVRCEPLDPMLWQLTELDRRLSARLHHHTALMWHRASHAQLDETGGEVPFRRPSPEDLLLHITSHMVARHTDFRLLWLHDVGLIASSHREQLDWAYLASAAHMLGLAAPVLAAFEATRWVGASLPPAGVRPAFRRRGGWGVLDRAEYGLLRRKQADLGAADLRAAPPSDFARKALSVLRLRGMVPRLRALRWALVPSRAYIGWWYGPGAARSRAHYLRTVGARLLPVTLRRLLTRRVDTDAT